MMSTLANNNINKDANNSQISLQVFASRYGHAALLDADGNELPITETMIRSACDEAMDTLYSFMPPKYALQLPTHLA